jgi:hypothetical protein
MAKKFYGRPRTRLRRSFRLRARQPFGRLWYGEPDAITNAIGYAKFRSRSHDAVIRVYDSEGNVIETHEQAVEFQFRILLSFQFNPFASQCSRSMRRAS